jgi:hypothetical protein
VPIEWTTVIEGGIPILGGLYASALGYGAVSRSQPQPRPPVLKTRSPFRWLGPLVVLFGCFAHWQAHLQAMHPPAELIARQIRNRMKFPITLDDTTRIVGVEGNQEHQRQEEQNLEPSIRCHIRISPDAAGRKPDTHPSAH